MSITPLAFSTSLQIGTIDFVSPDEIKVLIDIEAPDSIALNTGMPRSFPRLNSYVLIHNDDGFIVGQVEWITIERSAYPKRNGLKDFGLVDLPYPLRKMSLNPVGTLHLKEKMDINEEDIYSFNRGVEAFPSVGDSVLLPTQKQLRAIVESGTKRRVKIGTSPVAGNADVKIDPDKLFGRHLAVLGNTGSGKSCSVAGLIRWSLEAAQKECGDGKKPNARFIILDPNGEYSRAFKPEDGKVRVFSVEPKENSEQLRVPLWFWNSSEWCAFTQASSKTQSPILRRALREMRLGSSAVELNGDAEKENSLRRYLSTQIVYIRCCKNNNEIKTAETKFGLYLDSILNDIICKLSLHDKFKEELKRIISEIQQVLKATDRSFVARDGKSIPVYKQFTEKQIDAIILSIGDLLDSLGGIIYQNGPEENCPIPFDADCFAEHINQLSMQEGVSQYLDFLVMRVRTILSDTKMKTLVKDVKDVTLDEWLKDYIGDNDASNGTITVIDLSLVPAEVIHIITAVIARMIFEALQRYRKLDEEHKSLPTVLVMEEAHTFIKRYKEDSDNQDATAMCCKIFEKIAREGRKFGLGLVLSSQRPSELSPTVLSQCNTFLLHRISNDRDQELVFRLVPDNLKGLLRDLPSLSSQNAILLGWASELPVLVRMNSLPVEQQPQSDDPDFWDVWTRKMVEKDTIEIETKREINWKQVADDWQQISSCECSKTPDNFENSEKTQND